MDFLTSLLDTVQFSLADGTKIDLPVFQDLISTKESVQCDLCGSSISLRSHRSLHGFETHRGSNKCKKAAAQRERASTLAEAAEALAETQLSRGSNQGMSLLKYILYINQGLISTKYKWYYCTSFFLSSA
jgi:hypothetical protein